MPVIVAVVDFDYVVVPLRARVTPLTFARPRCCSSLSFVADRHFFARASQEWSATDAAWESNFERRLLQERERKRQLRLEQQLQVCVCVF